MMRSSAYTQFCSSVIFPLHERIKRHESTARRRALEESQWWSSERLEAHRVSRLRRFLTSIAATVPYYNRVFRGIAFDPVSIRGVSDLAALPLLTEDLIRVNTDDLKAPGAVG